MAVHGGNIDEISREYNKNADEMLEFSANINPLGISLKVKESMIKALDKVESYPDITYFKLKNSISSYESIASSNILLGNGAAEVIFNIVRGLKPKKVLLPAPTFSEYEEAVLSIDGEVIYHELKEEDDFKLDYKFVQAINEEIDMVFICNPNNPTGVLTSVNLVEEIAIRALECSAVVITDESFLDFIEEDKKYSAKELLNKYSNIIIVKSLTKFFSMPGIRIGYGLCNNSKITEKVNKVSVPWAINIVASEGVCRALDEKEYIQKTIEYVKREKEYLMQRLEDIEYIKVFKPSVNFIMFKVLKDLDLKSELIENNILIRNCDTYKGLNSSFYRVAVRTREENTKLINALKSILIDKL